MPVVSVWALASGHTTWWQLPGVVVAVVGLLVFAGRQGIKWVQGRVKADAEHHAEVEREVEDLRSQLRGARAEVGELKASIAKKDTELDLLKALVDDADLVVNTDEEVAALWDDDGNGADADPTSS